MASVEEHGHMAIRAEDLWGQLVPWLAGQLSAGNYKTARGITLALLPKLPYGDKGAYLHRLATEIDRRGFGAFAAELYALSHVHSEDDGRYRGQSRERDFPRLRRAVELDEAAGWNSLANELGDLLRRRCYPVCRASHLVPLCVAFEKLEQAKAVWEQSFAVIAHRFPDPDGGPPYALPEYSAGVDEGWKCDESLARLLLARVDHPDAIIKRTALAGVAVVVARAPRLLVRGLREVLRSQTPLTSVFFLFQTIWAAERSPYTLSAGLREELQQYAVSSLPALRFAAQRLWDRVREDS
ncbi:MAG TPA: hypothetical protein VKA46_09905 [Gemmataceae bacterium]|nr:hypothetical protein [Gemmataceae bacterium]